MSELDTLKAAIAATFAKIDQRLDALERDSHPPVDFTALFQTNADLLRETHKRMDALERRFEDRR